MTSNLTLPTMISSFLRPIVFVILALTIGSIWYFLFVNIMPVVILGRALSRREIFYWCSGLGYLGLCLFGGRTVWYSIGLWLILCLAHALLRKETIGAKFNSVVNRVSKPSRFEEALFGFLEEMFDIQDDSGPGVGARRIDHSFSRSHGSRALSAEADAVYVDPEDPQMQEYAAYRQNADENRSRRREIISQLQAKYGTHT